jgi:hypothetical protein
MPKKIDPEVKERCVRMVLDHLQEYPTVTDLWFSWVRRPVKLADVVQASVLDSWAERDVADLDVVGLLDGEGDGSGHGSGVDPDVRHPVLGGAAGNGVIDVVDELGPDKAWRDRGRAQDAVGGLLA